MRLLFVHDHRFYRDDKGLVYSSGALPAHVWERYLDHFESLRVLARDGGALPAEANYALSSCSGVDFDLVPNLTTHRQLLLRPERLRGMIRERIRSCDAALIRLPSELGFIAESECRSLGKPYAVEVVGCAWDGMVNHGSWLGKLYAPLHYYRTRRAVRRAPSALYVTSRWLQDRYPTDGSSCSASDVEIAPMTASERQAREARLRAIAEGRRPTLGTVASLRIRSKGIQTALAALEVLRKEGLELPYRVLGGGDPSPWIALAQSHGVADLVSFDGVRPAGAGVRSWLDAIDIHLQPSFQEGLPRATIEAMSRGAACIGSTCGGIPELIPPDRTHRPGDVAGLARCIRRLAADSGELAAASRTDLDASRTYEPVALRSQRDRFYRQLRAAAQDKSADGN